MDPRVITADAFVLLHLSIRKFKDSCVFYIVNNQTVRKIAGILAYAAS